MKTFSTLLVCLGMVLFASRVQAKHKYSSSTPDALATPAPEPPSLPPEAAPRINPAAPPFESLQPFMDAHLSTVLAPLGMSAFTQSEVLASLKASYADGLAAAPGPHRPAYQLAMGVCDALTGAITERQNAVTALRGALATRSSEAEQPRGGGEAVSKARDGDAFFVDSQKNTWLQRTTVLRQSITALYLRERAAERQAGVWAPPPAAAASAPDAPAVVAATPSVSALPQGWDPVIGQWLLEGRSALTLGADHTISGDRHGTWSYTCTTNGGRNYELHWNPPKHWVDYLVLAGDGRTMGGKTRDSKPISYYRP